MRRLLILAAAPFALSASAPAFAVPAEGLVWTWEPGQERSWFIEAEVVLPAMILPITERSKESRMVAFQTETVLTCTQVEALGKRKHELGCTVADFAIRGATMRGDSAESTTEILEAMDDHVTGAELQVRMRSDGRIVNVDLEGVVKNDPRRAQMHEVMRIILARSLAGLDLQLPRGGASEAGVWGQYQAMLMDAPTDVGTSGSAEIAHLVRSVDEDYVIIETAGRGTITPGGMTESSNFFESVFESVSVFDNHAGMLRERMWVFQGLPTASSAVAEGGAGVPYIQRGRLLYLPEGADRPVLGETMQVEPPGESRESAIMDWVTIGSRS